MGLWERFDSLDDRIVARPAKNEPRRRHVLLGVIFALTSLATAFSDWFAAAVTNFHPRLLAAAVLSTVIAPLIAFVWLTIARDEEPLPARSHVMVLAAAPLLLVVWIFLRGGG